MTSSATTTFLFTDLVGSTEVLETLGDDAGASWSDIHLNILREALKTHGGHEVKSLGDGLMVTFSSASEGVAAAIDMQQGVRRHNLSGERPNLHVRVGIHSGEPIQSGGDFFGMAVVIAARLCHHAQGGQVVVSGVVRELVGRRGNFAFVGLGDLRLKGLTQPIKAYSVLWDGSSQSASSTPNDDSESEIRSERIPVLIVEDEPLWASLLAQSLSENPRITVVGSARDGEGAIDLAQKLQPAAVLMDIMLKGRMNGIEAAIEIKRLRPGTGIVILSAHSDRRFVTSLPLTESPGWSYLLKQSVPDTSTLVRAVEASVDGLVMLDPEIVAKLRPRAASPLAALEPIELEILHLMAGGYTYADIAARLLISEADIKAHLDKIHEGLGLVGEPDARTKATVALLEETQIVQ